MTSLPRKNATMMITVDGSAVSNTIGPDEPDRALSADELEIAWSLHGELFYLAIRRWVYGMKTPDDLGPIIRAAVVCFLEGAPAAMCDLRKTHLASELPQQPPARGARRVGGGGRARRVHSS